MPKSLALADSPVAKPALTAINPAIKQDALPAVRARHTLREASYGRGTLELPKSDARMPRPYHDQPAGREPLNIS